MERAVKISLKNCHKVNIELVTIEKWPFAEVCYRSYIGNVRTQLI